MPGNGTTIDELAEKVGALGEAVATLEAQHKIAEQEAEAAAADDAAYKQATARVEEVRSQLASTRERRIRAQRALTQTQVAALDREIEAVRARYFEAHKRSVALRGDMSERIRKLHADYEQATQSVRDELVAAESKSNAFRHELAGLEERRDALVGNESA